MAKGKSVRHHFIPQFYLKGFADPQNPPFIWVYRKDSGDIIKSSVKDAAVHKHYYSFKSQVSGTRDSQTLEKWLGDIEASVSKIYRKIINKQKINNLERSRFSTFLALTLTRVPNYRENMINKPTAQLMKRIQTISASSRRRFEIQMKQYEKDTGTKLSVPVEQLRQYILKGNYDIKVTNPGYSLGFMVETAQDLAPIFHKMNWAFLEITNDKYFLTCDNPLYYTDPTHKPNSFYGVGLMNREIEVTLPLSKELALLATWKGLTGYHTATKKIRDTINGRTIISAQNFVFAPEKSIKISRTVKRFKGSSPKMKVS